MEARSISGPFRCLSVVAVCAGLLFADGVTIRLDSSGGKPAFRIDGWTATVREDWREVFAVYAGAGQDLPPLLGAYHVEAGTLIFEPRFPLTPGMRYRAVFRGAAAPVVATFDIPKPAAEPTTVVERVYPTADRLPENLLKFYIHFSAPMSRGEVYRHVHLLEENGAEVSLPFLELDEELWDREGKRLTLLFDPGRIKRGLLPNQEAGVPMQAGKRYTLVIDRECRDAQGLPLKKGHRKEFVVGPPDREAPDLKEWRVTAPSGGTASPLTVEFPKPLDHALLERMIQVIGPGSDLVHGRITVDREETRWQFTPERSWIPGDYALIVETTLEDVAGNTIGKPFDVDVFERVQDRINHEARPLRFRISASPAAPVSPTPK